MNASDQSNSSQSQPLAASVDKLFLTYGNAGISASLVAVLGFKAMLALLAMVANGSLVWLTMRSRQLLQSNCNWLIGLNALNTALFTLGPLPPFLVVLCGLNFIPVQRCILFQALPYVTFNAQICLCLAIGMDRLLSVLCPVFYRSLLVNRRLYFLLVALLCYFYSATQLYNAFNHMLLNPNRPVMCSTIDIEPAFQSSDYIMLHFNFLLNLVTPLCYVLLGLVLRYRIGGQNQLQQSHQQVTRKIFKAVFVLMLLQLFGWLFNQLLQLGLQFARLDAVSAWFVRNIGAYPLYMALALDSLVLYLFSQDYQKAFVDNFPWLAKLLCRPHHDHTVVASASWMGTTVGIGRLKTVADQSQLPLPSTQRTNSQRQSSSR